ncbi:unnamed protein product [Nezara viridula]|uniref:Uncharacterized protein n=1 Tax=Nezara viridula TaxID=85310 RepID=A0A9P0H5T1_NEZVI|nr:unnamed protein product [Nezara viridula]
MPQSPNLESLKQSLARAVKRFPQEVLCAAISDWPRRLNAWTRKILVHQEIKETGYRLECFREEAKKAHLVSPHTREKTEGKGASGSLFIYNNVII